MSEELVVGKIVDGTIVRVKDFGAIVTLPGDKKGLVHISQISSKFVEDITKFISVGDNVKVKILTIDEDGTKFSLSMKEAVSEPEKTVKTDRPARPYKPRTDFDAPKKNPSTNSFEDKFSDWLKESNEKQATLNKRSKRR